MSEEKEKAPMVPPYRFVALKDFEALRSLYVKDMAYTVRPGNDALHQRVQRWAAEGLVKVVGGAPLNNAAPGLTESGSVLVSGTGEVH